MFRNRFCKSLAVTIIVAANWTVPVAGAQSNPKKVPVDRERLARANGATGADVNSPAAVASMTRRQDEPRPDLREYRIGASDLLAVDVWKESDASVASAPVRPDGKISLPMIGELPVAGLTPAELENILTAKYREFIRDARVTVMVKEINSQKAYLIGEVRKEGPIRLQAPITVLQALAEAGGVTDYAKRRKIYILRGGPKGKVVLPFDYDAVVRGEKIEQNILLAVGDTIVVPR